MAKCVYKDKTRRRSLFVLSSLALLDFCLPVILDGFVPFDRARGLADAIQGARFEVIAGAGHAVVVEQPERVVELCREFLADVS